VIEHHAATGIGRTDMEMRAAPKRTPVSDRKTGCYVYGIVPADVEIDPGATGVGDPPARISLVKEGQIAALISEIDLARPIGRPEDLIAHEELLDATVREVPVLPLRFGAVLSDPESVATDLLAASHDELSAALADLEGRTEYVVHGRYLEDVLLGEVVSENPDVAKLREATRGQPETETRDALVQLGELVGAAIEGKRAADGSRAVEALSPHCVAVVVRAPSHEHDAFRIAALVETGKRAQWNDAVESIARDWRSRMTVRLLGPLAPYDFVSSESTPAV
jgi:gas vesicle protein GvpL/GvpF